jgi:hypothetical protein
LGEKEPPTALPQGLRGEEIGGKKVEDKKVKGGRKGIGEGEKMKKLIEKG